MTAEIERTADLHHVVNFQMDPGLSLCPRPVVCGKDLGGWRFLSVIRRK